MIGEKLKFSEQSSDGERRMRRNSDDYEIKVSQSMVVAWLESLGVATNTGRVAGNLAPADPTAPTDSH